MARIRVLPYKPNSAGAKRIAVALGGKRLRMEGSKFKPRDNDVVINWGSGDGFHSSLANARVFNHPKFLTSNKLEFYKAYSKLVPEFTIHMGIAQEWLRKDGNPHIVCRTILNGQGGAGIFISDNEANLIKAKVYTKYIKKAGEYRIHFFGDKLIFAQQKKRREGVEYADYKVRNHDNGFVFCHKEIQVPWQVTEICNEFLKVTGMDFGALDVVWNAKREKAYILEVNSAPGNDGETTLEKYVEAFKGAI